MQAETDLATNMTKLASDYGPFLFAILFSLIVPIRAFQNFRDAITRVRETFNPSSRSRSARY